MANWRYENAGSLDLLINARGNTVNCYNKPQYSRTGIAFQQYRASRQKNFDIPATTEIWIKFDFAFNQFSSGHRIYIGDLYNDKVTGIYLNGSSSSNTYSRNFLFNGATVSREKSILQTETLYRGLLHMRAGSSDGLIEWLDSEGHTLTYTGNVNDGNPFENLFVETYDDRYGTYCYISNVIISNQTVSINENVDWLPLNITFDLKSLLTSTATINFDLTRDVNVKAIWRYENYGSASLLKVSGTTVTGLDATKSKTGSAFWQKNRVATFDIPATKELWVKFDLYYGGTKWRAYDRLNGKDTGVGRYQQTNSLTSFINGPLEYTLNPKNTIATNTLKTYLLHMVSDAENGIVELWVDGVKYYSDDFADEGLIYKGNVENGADFANFYLQSDDANNLFSNVIISNAPIGLGENVLGYNIQWFFDFDLARQVERHWRYENYGTSDLLSLEAETVSVSTDISKYGSGYYLNQDQALSVAKTFDFNMPQTTDIWVKCDFYLDNPSDKFGLYVVNRNNTDFSSGIYIKLYAKSYSWTVYLDDDTQRTYTGSYDSKGDRLKTVIVRMRAGEIDSDGLIDASVNGTHFKVSSYNVQFDNSLIGVKINNGLPFDNISIFSSSDTALIFSNIILSSAEINQDDNAKMPLIVNYDLVRDTREYAHGVSVTIDFDLARNITKNWIYYNHGTSELLLVDTETVSVDKNKSIYGTGYYFNYEQALDGKCFDIPTDSDIWIKFDVYLDDPTELFEIYAVNMDSDYPSSFSDGVGIRAPQKSMSVGGTQLDTDYYEVLARAEGTTAKSEDYTDRTKINNLETVLVHLKAGKYDGLIESWFNGQKRASYTGNVHNGKPFDNISIFSGDTKLLFSNIIISNTELTLDDISGFKVTALFDTKRIVTKMWNDDVWRYENEGIADLLTVAGTTVENLEKSQAVYKTAFYQTSRAKCFDIPSTKEIWIKCDVYCNLTNRWRVYNGGANGTTGLTSQTSGEASLFSNDTNVKQFTSSTIKKNQLQTVLLHMVSDSSAGIVEAWLDGTKLYTYTGNVNNGDAFADIYLQSDGAGTFFSNVIISNAPIGLGENVQYPLTVIYDLIRSPIKPHQMYLDTVRNITRSVNLSADTLCIVDKSIAVDFDLLRDIDSTVQFDVDLVRTLPHNVILSPVNDFGGVPDTSNDGKALCQNFEVRLNEQSLTDSIIVTLAKPIDIMEQVKGQYLDYKYNMCVESIKQRGILNTCTCCSDIDEILYKQLEYTIPDDELWRFTNPEEVLRNFPGIKVFRRDSAPLIEEDDDNSEDLALASTHIATIANIIGKKPILQYADFISTVDITSGGTTYNDLIRSIFGWTARIPQHMINCFLRDDKLFVIQRGFEQNEINLSNLAGCEIVGVDKELMRTIWGSSVWSKTETREVFGFRYLDNLIWSDNDDESSQPSASPKSSTSHNKGGLINETTEYHNGVKTTTKYDYDGDGLVIATSVYVESDEIITHTKTTYEYITLGDGRKVLAEEKIREEELINGHWETIDEKTTKHEYTSASPGQVHHYTTDSDGNVNNVMGSGTGDDRRTPYAKWITAKGHRSLISYTSKQKNYQQQRTIYGLTPFDTSFPVHGDEKLIEITDAIKWLNRKTQETLTINLFDYPHVIDFNDRVVINGNVYYLKGNTALKTRRIVNKQTLSIVRWY